MGARGRGPHRRAVRRRPAHHRGRHRGRAGAHRVFGDLDDVARAKGELVEALPAAGTPCSTPTTRGWRRWPTRTSARAVLYGTDAADVRADRGGARRRAAGPRSCWSRRGGSTAVHLGVRGRTRSPTRWRRPPSRCVCDVADRRGRRGARASELSPWRMDLRTAPSGARVLNDAYNAGPASMAAALRARGPPRRRPPPCRARAHGRARCPRGAGGAPAHRRPGRRAGRAGDRGGRARLRRRPAGGRRRRRRRTPWARSGPTTRCW